MTVSGASAAYRPISPGFQPNDEEGASRLQQCDHGVTLFGVLLREARMQRVEWMVKERKRPSGRRGEA